jgi:hypothetical protein
MKAYEAFKGGKEAFPVAARYDNFGLVLFILIQVTASPFPHTACRECS